MVNQSKPYVLFIAEIIYKNVVQIKLQYPNMKNEDAINKLLETDIYENLSSGKLHNDWFNKLKANSSKAKRILKLVGLSGKESRKAYMISGGEKRRVAIARALMQKPTILLADEIVSELDHVTAREIMDLILDAQKKMNLTAIMVHHDMALALEYANRVAVMKEGQKILEIGVEGDAIVDFQAGDMSIEEIMEMYNTDAKE